MTRVYGVPGTGRNTGSPSIRISTERTLLKIILGGSFLSWTDSALVSARVIARSASKRSSEIVRGQSSSPRRISSVRYNWREAAAGNVALVTFTSSRVTVRVSLSTSVRAESDTIP